MLTLLSRSCISRRWCGCSSFLCIPAFSVFRTRWNSWDMARSSHAQQACTRRQDLGNDRLGRVGGENCWNGQGALDIEEMTTRQNTNTKMPTLYNSRRCRCSLTRLCCARNGYGEDGVGSCGANGGEVQPTLSDEGPPTDSPDRYTLAGGDRSGDEGKVSGRRYSSERSSAVGEVGGFLGALGDGWRGGNAGTALDWRCRFPLRTARFS